VIKVKRASLLGCEETVVAFVVAFLFMFLAVHSSRITKKGIELSPWFVWWVFGGIAFFCVGAILGHELRTGAVAVGIWSFVLVVTWNDARRRRGTLR